MEAANSGQFQETKTFSLFFSSMYVAEKKQEMWPNFI